jgi:hypothetical protein
MKSRLVALMIVAAFMTGAAAYAHHSFAGSYVENKLVTLEGKVVEFNLRNPHSFISFEVTEKDGKTVRWGGEWGGVTQLTESGVNKFTLKVGDKIVVDGAPSRDPDEHKVLVRAVAKPGTDWKWQGRVQ